MAGATSSIGSIAQSNKSQQAHSLMHHGKKAAKAGKALGTQQQFSTLLAAKQTALRSSATAQSNSSSAGAQGSASTPSGASATTSAASSTQASAAGALLEG
jgi:hypothetical protein